MAFDELLGNLRLTATEQTIASQRVSHVQSFFLRNYVVAKAPWTIGSYGRETIIRPRRDVDMMVALDVATYWDRYQGDSARFLYWLRDALNAEYSNTQVSTKQVAVRMLLGSDLQVDLVPTFARTGGGFLMPDGHSGWQATNPPYHDDLMASANVRTNSQLKPLVRLMKAWNHVNGKHLRSFHLEMVVAKVWENANGSLGTTAHAVTETLRCGGSWIRNPMMDPWAGSGARLDDYLAADLRASVARTLDEDAGRAAAALAYEESGRIADAFERWGVVFNRTFPAYG